jgi:dTDP-4-amino-4,6-dideoxygalactose transaminase
VTRPELPFNRPYRTGAEPELVLEALNGGWTGGNGPFSGRCERLLVEQTGARAALLTPSCTGALEMAAVLADVGPGDEVIVPSFTFVSTANAFVLRGATPVFVEIAPDTLTMDADALADAVTPATRVVVPVHYAGGACAMDEIAAIAERHELTVVEDAAQGVGATWQGRALGALGALGALSFHETKNVSCGEGGALLINDERFAARAEVLQEKGTNRAGFARGEVGQYTWIDLGSSYLMSDVTAALLLAQLERVAEITAARRALWSSYHAAFEGLEREGRVQRPRFTAGSEHNGHIYYLLLSDRAQRDELIRALRSVGIQAHFHYVPLHSSPAGLRFGRTHGELPHTDAVAGRLIRLPLWMGMNDADVERVCEAVACALR